jgi:hypothetical protein
MTSVAAPALETARPHDLSPAAHFVGRRYIRLVVVLGALMAIGPLTIDTYLPALPSSARRWTPPTLRSSSPSLACSSVSVPAS